MMRVFFFSLMFFVKWCCFPVCLFCNFLFFVCLFAFFSFFVFLLFCCTREKQDSVSDFSHFWQRQIFCSHDWTVDFRSRVFTRTSHDVAFETGRLTMGIFANKNRAKKRYLSFSNNKLNVLLVWRWDVHMCEWWSWFISSEKILASLSFCLFLIIFFLVLLFFFFFFIPKETKSACFSTTTTHQQTQRKNNNKRKSIDPSSNQNARRATIGRVLRRTRERARREAIERDRSSSGGEHREEQFRTRWVGQGIIVKILFSNREKVNVGIAMDRFFLSLSLSLLKALRRARRLAEVL